MKKATTEQANPRCLCCGNIMSVGKTPKAGEVKSLKTFSRYYQQIGVAPICRDCATELFKQLCNAYGNKRIAIFYICRIMDWPYVQEVFEDADDIEECFALYYRNLCVGFTPRMREGFFHGDYISEKDLPTYVEAEIVSNEVINNKERAKKDERKENLYIKWGRNNSYADADYDDLEDIYQRIAKQNGIITDDKTGEIADKVTELAVIEASCYLLESRKARNRRDAENAKRYYDLYDKAMGSQLLRGKDLKDKQVGDMLVQDIVKYCESDEFIEPWDKKIQYPHKKDVVDQILLHIMNYVGKLTADIFNKHVSKLDKLPADFKISGRNDEFPKEETDFDKLYKKNLEDIADFKARQHISDDDSDDDSADLDDDTESDEALFGSEDGDA